MPLFKSCQSPATCSFCSHLCSARSLALCHTPRRALDLGTGCEPAEAQEQDSSGRKGTRERAAGQVAWGVPQMEPSVPGPGLRGAAGRPGIRFQWAFAGQQQECTGEEIPFCMANVCSCLTAQFAFPDCTNHGWVTVAWAQVTDILSLLCGPSSNNHDCFLSHLTGIFPYLTTSS